MSRSVFGKVERLHQGIDTPDKVGWKARCDMGYVVLNFIINLVV